MLHRFRAPDLGVHAGHDPQTLRKVLEVLRRRRYPLVSLEDVFQRLVAGEAPPSAGVVFTLDDGYAEQALVAGPIFADYDCPSTTFVTTGFLDGTEWFWWDRISYVLTHTDRPRVEFVLDGKPVTLECRDTVLRDRAVAGITEQCKRVSNDEKLAGIARLAAAAGVELPPLPPRGKQPMTWDDLRTAERYGMSFAPHTVTHPVLSRMTEEASRFELEESWRRLAEEAARPVKVFCYPNGGFQDFGPRETSCLASLGFLGAVVGVSGFASRTATRAERYEVRRFPYPEDPPHFLQYASGVERLKMIARGIRA